MLVFGGLQGLEAAIENDYFLNESDPRVLFDYYVNTVPNQGSRTIRTEEAVLISLATLYFKITPLHKGKKFTQQSSIACSTE